MPALLPLLLLACASRSPEASEVPGGLVSTAGGAASVSGYRYDGGTGRCVDATGNEGRNTGLDIAQLRLDGKAECADLRGVELLPPSTGDLVGWDLRGADLTGAELYFSALTDADLRGTDLSGFKFGYVHIRGQVDAFTRPPPSCAPEGGQLDCTR